MAGSQQNTNISDAAGIHSPIEPSSLTGGYDSLVEVQSDATRTLSFLVKGVHCAACIQKIESTLLTDKDVCEARLNFSTGRLSLAWKGGNDLANHYAQKIEALGYSVFPYSLTTEKQETEKEWRFLLMCLGIVGFAMGNIMLLSVGVWITDSETMGSGLREFLHWFAALIGVPAVIFSGQPFFRSAWSVLKHKQTNMDVPISLALILAVGMSLSELLRGGEHVYFDSAVMLMFFLLIGRVLDFKARRSARSAATDLMATLTGFATVLSQGKTQLIPIQNLQEGMIVLVAAGEKFPIDGTLSEGTTSVDTSLVTGETLPRTLQKGEDVYAGTLNLDAPVQVRVARAAEDSLLADIVRLMEKAEQGQARYVRLADRAAKLYTPVVHILALSAFVLWWGFLGASWQTALMVAVTVLIITCPCALGLAVPVVQVLASGILMKKGILIKAGDALERLASIDTVFVDKTGTLTYGRPDLIGDYPDDQIQVAASLAVHSNHPLSQSLSAYYHDEYVGFENVREISGSGLEGIYQGQTVRLGKRSWCGDETAPSYDGPELWLSYNGAKTQFYFSDTLRTDAKQTMSGFKNQSITPVLLSGDREHAVRSVAQACGIDQVFANLNPAEKYDLLQKYQGQGHSILMIGDGLNDAPVLSGADISMAPGSAIDVSQNAADIVFMGDCLHPVMETHAIAVKTQRLIKQNFVLAVLYNVVAVPIAFMGFVTPMIAAIAMSGSSLLVIANAFRLKLR